MTGTEMKDIRIEAGLSIKDMSRLLGLNDARGPDRVRDMEAGRKEISGPVETILKTIKYDCSPLDLT